MEVIKTPKLDNEGLPIIVKSGINKGSIKLQNKNITIRIKGLGLRPLDEWKCKKEGFYKTNEDILKLISKDNGDAGKIARLILEIRGLSKELNTYYTGIEEIIYEDGCVRSNYNHTATDTSRLSSNNPNLQNVPRYGESRVKEIFVSRY